MGPFSGNWDAEDVVKDDGDDAIEQREGSSDVDVDGNVPAGIAKGWFMVGRG